MVPRACAYINTGRFHFVDTFKSTSLDASAVMLSPPERYFWYTRLLQYVGNCRIAISKCAWGLQLCFNLRAYTLAPFKVLERVEHNYGEILMLWTSNFLDST